MGSGHATPKAQRSRQQEEVGAWNAARDLEGYLWWSKPVAKRLQLGGHARMTSPLAPQTFHLKKTQRQPVPGSLRNALGHRMGQAPRRQGQQRPAAAQKRRQALSRRRTRRSLCLPQSPLKTSLRDKTGRPLLLPWLLGRRTRALLDPGQPPPAAPRWPAVFPHPQHSNFISAQLWI